jgi:Holliday junction resolvasome RuvABC DNA-binding subunit
MTNPPPDNQQVASVLVEVAQLLEAQGANPFRIGAYRKAAETVRALDEPLWQLLEREGLAGLRQLPGIGQSLAHTIAHLIHNERLPLLERLRGEKVPERMFATVADIGPKLAHRIHESLGIETLGELAAAASDGRLARVPGMGPKRLRAVRESLAGRFHVHDHHPPVHDASGPSASTLGAQARTEDADPVPIDELLDIDHQYRQMAERGQLPKIAPRRFNPTHEAWLPVLHTERMGRHYTALFSNTAHAHELDATHDWVVIYRDDQDHSGCWTAITAGFGPLRGHRIIRGRERDCAEHYGREVPPEQPKRVQKWLI